ncbi:hypothetical protein N665_1330s0009 [Sinapis alba]|nr:hypothetical protein N665_1330s0009 [Sinapis alba]
MGCCGSKSLPASDLVPEGELGTILGKPLVDFNKLYKLGKELGKGGFATTYMCQELSTGQSFACKSLPKRRNLTSQEDKEAVKTEIKIMKELSGVSNIVQFHDAYEDKKFVHIVMELCRGGELYDMIGAHGYYTEKDAAGIFKSIVNAVQICHSVDVVHRDLKPENFLFSSEDEESAELKAIDFGCSVYIKEGE